MSKGSRKRGSLEQHRRTSSSKTTKGNLALVPPDLTSLLKGLYGTVANQLDLDPLYVRRVARGEDHSELIENALSRELKAIVKRIERRGGSKKQSRTR
jgi:hypothetical protein